MENIGFWNAGIVALLGYGVVFLGLILLMIVVMLTGKVFTVKENRKGEQTPIGSVPEPETPPALTAPGSAGQLKLHNVDPKTAAMLMAIVADKIGRPVNELRFISIKEVS